MRRVYYAEIDFGEAPSCFGEALSEHLNAITNQGKRKASWSAWRLLECALMEAHVPRVPKVAFLDGGKPCFLESDLYFSISHSGNLCAVSLSDCLTGVDVERVRKTYSPALIRRTLSPAEEACFDGDFTRLWCRKESMAKLTGVGLTAYPMYLDTVQARYVFSESELCDLSGNEYRICAAFEEGDERVKWLHMDTHGGL